MKNIIGSNENKTVILSSKELTRTDLDCQLVLPTEMVRRYLILKDGRVTERITAYDNNGKQWIFPLYTRPGPDPKPTITKASWHPFVEEFSLCDGDAVLFYTRQDDASDDKIYIRGMRKKILFKGKATWVEVQKN